MKTIKILITASRELDYEKIVFSDLIVHLNDVLEPRGIEIERIKWEPNTDGSIEEFNAILQDCEICISLYWCDLSVNSEKELDCAYQRLRENKNPRNLYVFFKEPTVRLTEALKDFKTNFVSKYGHFFCKFENVDTMKLNFLLQFEAYQNLLQDQRNQLFNFKDGKIIIDDVEIVNLDKVPFAALNKEFQRLQQELKEIDNKLVNIRTKYKANPNNEELEDELFVVKTERKKIADEFCQCQNHLYDIALSFVKKANEGYSERMIRAHEQFEKGNTIEADLILNMEEMKKEASLELKQYDQHLNNLRIKIEEFRLKADTVMANTLLTMKKRYVKACEAFVQAIVIADIINYDEEEKSLLLFDFAYLHYMFNKLYDAIKYYNKSLDLCQKLRRKTNSEDINYKISCIYNNIACIYYDLCNYDVADEYFEKALDFRTKLVKGNPDRYLPDLSETLNNYAILKESVGQFDKAEEIYKKAMGLILSYSEDNSEVFKNISPKILHNIAVLDYKNKKYGKAEYEFDVVLQKYSLSVKHNPIEYQPRIAMVLNNKALLMVEQKKYDEAESAYCEAMEIFKDMLNDNPDIALPNLGDVLNNIAILYTLAGKPEEAEKSYFAALDIRQRLAKKIPEKYDNKVAETLCNLARLHYAYKEYEKSKDDFSTAYEIFFKYSKTSKWDYFPKMADTLYQIATICTILGQNTEADNRFQASLSIYNLMALDFPEKYTVKEAHSLFNYALVKYDAKLYDNSKQLLLMAQDLFIELRKKGYGDFDLELNKIEKLRKDLFDE